MIYCILAKLSVSVIAATFYFKNMSGNPLLISFLIGVLPIWFEVLASFLTKIEPAREQRFIIKTIDNLVDSVVFILMPAIWYSFFQKIDLTIIIFILAGIWRLIKFVRLKKVGDFFIGLPVTYTGYIWPILILTNKIAYHNILLIILAWAMNSQLIKIKVPIYETT
jgi:hypothetical protein